MQLPPPTPSAFVYGTLRIPEVLHKVLGRVPTHEPARLSGFRSRRLRHFRYPGMVAAKDEHVSGLLLRQLTPEDWEKLDHYEGEMYEPTSVTVSTRGEVLEATTYVLRGAFSGLLTEELWSLEDFTARELDAFLRELDAP